MRSWYGSSVFALGKIHVRELISGFRGLTHHDCCEDAPVYRPGVIVRLTAAAAWCLSAVSPCVVLTTTVTAMCAANAVHAAPARAAGVEELARRAAAGDADAPQALESLLERFFTGKGLWTLEEGEAVSGVSTLLGSVAGPGSVRWFRLDAGAAPVRLLTLDLGVMSPAASGAGRGYVAYAIAERAGSGQPKVSWYHDLGKKVEEQGGAAWHPLHASLLAAGAAGAGRTILVEASPSLSSAAAGLIVLEQRQGDWTATRRIAPAGGARLIAAGPGGAVFLAEREPPKGVLTGAPRGTFRSLVLYERREDGWAAQPVLAPVADVVSAAEGVMAALRRGEKDEARRLCTSPDLVDQLLYFTPGWKGGGRVVRLDERSLEIAYEERDRPSLRLQFTFQDRSGALLMASATGRAEKPGGR